MTFFRRLRHRRRALDRDPRLPHQRLHDGTPAMPGRELPIAASARSTRASFRSPRRRASPSTSRRSYPRPPSGSKRGPLTFSVKVCGCALHAARSPWRRGGKDPAWNAAGVCRTGYSRDGLGQLVAFLEIGNTLNSQEDSYRTPPISRNTALVACVSPTGAFDTAACRPPAKVPGATDHDDVLQRLRTTPSPTAWWWPASRGRRWRTTRTVRASTWCSPRRETMWVTSNPTTTTPIWEEGPNLQHSLASWHRT